MPSLALRLQNLRTRLLKPIVNSNYDPVAMRKRLAKPSKLVAESERVEVGAFALERRGDPSSRTAIVYTAGGGFFLGPDDRHRRLLDTVCRAVGAQGVIVHHRLAPEHPFPIPVEDVSAGLEHALASFGIEGFAMMGDSSGGTVALSVLLGRRDRRESMPAAGVFLSPYTDLANTGLSLVENAVRDPVFGPAALIHKSWHYLQGHDPTDPRASPLWAELRDLPPLLLVAGTTEVMRDDTVRFADRMRRAGGRVQVSLYDQAPHVFPLLALPESRRAVQEIEDFLARAFGSGQGASWPSR